VHGRWLKECSTWNSVASFIATSQHAMFLSVTQLLSRSVTLDLPGTSITHPELTSSVTAAAAADDDDDDDDRRVLTMVPGHFSL